MASSLVIKTPLLVGVEKRNYGAFKSMQPALERTSSSSYNFNNRNKTLVVKASGGRKIKTNAPYGINGGLSLEGGVDASGRRAKGKGVYQFVDKYGANVDGYSPIYSPEEWSPSGDVYTGGKGGLLLWAITLAGILGGGALLVYNTSALAQ